VLRWIDFAREAPDVARRGRELLFQRGEGFAFLATIDAGGAPRLHPIVVVQEEGGLYAFLTPSPKRRDLERDPRFALHAFPHPDRDDEFVIRGRAVRIEDPALLRQVAQYFEAGESHHLYEFLVGGALLAVYQEPGAPPRRAAWTADDSGAQRG
jgi:hypothetical protein